LEKKEQPQEERQRQQERQLRKTQVVRLYVPPLVGTPSGGFVEGEGDKAGAAAFEAEFEAAASAAAGGDGGAAAGSSDAAAAGGSGGGGGGGDSNANAKKKNSNGNGNKGTRKQLRDDDRSPRQGGRPYSRGGPAAASTSQQPTVSFSASPPPPQLSSSPAKEPSPAKERAVRATKTVAAARAHYLRTAVDPVFVPLLDAVVFHKPRDVTTFVAERSLRQLLARGTESEREVVRAMMKRLLDTHSPPPGALLDHKQAQQEQPATN